MAIDFSTSSYYPTQTKAPGSGNAAEQYVMMVGSIENTGNTDATGITISVAGFAGAGLGIAYATLYDGVTLKSSVGSTSSVSFTNITIAAGKQNTLIVQYTKTDPVAAPVNFVSTPPIVLSGGSLPSSVNITPASVSSYLITGTYKTPVRQTTEAGSSPQFPNPYGQSYTGRIVFDAATNNVTGSSVSTNHVVSVNIPTNAAAMSWTFTDQVGTVTTGTGAFSKTFTVSNSSLSGILDFNITALSSSVIPGKTIIVSVDDTWTPSGSAAVTTTTKLYPHPYLPAIPADLSTSSVTFSPSTAIAGSAVNFTITIPNTAGISGGATSVAITNAVPSNVTSMVWGATGTSGVVGLPVGGQTGAVGITGVTIPSGGSVTITGQMTINPFAAVGTITSTATISATGITAFNKSGNLSVTSAAATAFNNTTAQAQQCASYTNASQCAQKVLVVINYGKANVSMVAGNDWTIKRPTTFSIAPVVAQTATDYEHRIVASMGSRIETVSLGNWVGVVVVPVSQTLNVCIKTEVSGNKVASTTNALDLSPANIQILSAF